MDRLESALLPRYEPELVISSNDTLGICHFVVDRFVLGRCWGGFRVASDLDLEEVKVLARSMTLKSIMAGIPIGGAKGGLNIASNDYDRQAIARSVARTLSPFLKKGSYFLGTDLGFNEADVDAVLTLSKATRRLFRGAVSVGDACAMGILACVQYANRTHPGFKARTVALEGFGRVGVPTARLLSLEGFRVVAVGTLYGTVCEPHGLNVEDLAALSFLGADQMLQTYVNAHPAATLHPKEYVNVAEADVLIPGARALTLDAALAEQVRAKIVCPLSNSPVSAQGEKILAERRIISIPDFISNAGGIIASFAQQLAANSKETHALISKIVTSNLEMVFRGLPAGEIPKEKACQIAVERLDQLSSNERLESLRLMICWTRALGPKAVFKGLSEYASLKLLG